MKRNKILLTLGIFLLFFLVGGATFYFFGQDIMQWFGPKDTNVPGGAISKNEPLKKCIPGDKNCETKNDKIMANRLEGPVAKFVSHQCDGPRGCPSPTDEEEKVIVNAIRAYVKDDTLELIPINGITPTGIAYYCAADNRCWSYDTKSKKVEALSTETLAPSNTQ